MFKFAVLDPRPIPAAEEANSKVLGPNTLGIEVTIPVLAVRCGLGNIDPQHSGGDAGGTAIEWAVEEAFEAASQLADATFVTVRADLDSIGAMAVMEIGSIGVNAAAAAAGVVSPGGVYYLPDLMGRVRLVAESDRFARGGWPGPRSLPTKENPWPETQSARPLAAIAAAVGDHKVPIAERVAAMQRWLLTGEEPAGYRDRVEAERLEVVRILEQGRIKAEAVADGRIAQVVSTHRAATSIGYALAPIVVALNPEFRFQGGPAHAKFTVCQFTGGFVDLKAAAAELSGREDGWGGSPTIIGSPQGVGSKLALDEVVEVVARHLIEK